MFYSSLCDLFFSTVSYYSLLCSVLLYRVLLFSTVSCSSLLCPVLLYCVLFFSTVSYSSLLCPILLSFVLLFSSVLYAPLLCPIHLSFVLFFSTVFCSSLLFSILLYVFYSPLLCSILLYASYSPLYCLLFFSNLSCLSSSRSSIFVTSILLQPSGLPYCPLLCSTPIYKMCKFSFSGNILCTPLLLFFCHIQCQVYSSINTTSPQPPGMEQPLCWGYCWAPALTQGQPQNTLLLSTRINSGAATKHAIVEHPHKLRGQHNTRYCWAPAFIQGPTQNTLLLSARINSGAATKHAIVERPH